MRIPSFLLYICFLLSFNVSSAQYYNTGQDPGSLKWMQIKTGRFTVIYPKTYGDAALDFVRSLDHAYSKLATLYPEKKFRIPVIIHNYSLKSNGYVAWAPSRMEVYPTPEQNSIPLDANTQLAIHELTHVIQMESLNRGFTKAMSFIAGEQFPGVVSALLPLWFLEGDAVYAESVLTESGRGRSASFQKQLKALMIENGNVYNYDKSVNGSFRNYVPDHYQYGYQMMAWSYAKYNPVIWRKALNFTAEAPFTLNPVNLSLFRSASLTKKRLFRETFDTLKTLWTSDYLKSESETYEVINPPKGRKYVNYNSPALAGFDSVIAIKTSLSRPASFVLIRPSDKSEKRIHIPGDCNPRVISYGNGKLCWVETHSDPRWENRAWSVVKVMDIRKKSVRQLSSRTRYMSASISPDGNFIAATENTIDNKNGLVILDAWNGFKLEVVPAPDNASLQRPQWDESGKIVSVIYLNEKGEGILSYDTKEKKWNTLVEAAADDIQSSIIRNDSLFFVSSSSGTDNIYLLRPDKSVVPVTRSKFGVSDLTVNGHLLVFSDYSSSGSNICYTTMPTGNIDGEIIKNESSYLINRYKPSRPPLKDYSDPDYTPVPYRKWQHLFRLHSWMPFYADLEKIQDDPASISPGLTLMTQNNLSTLVSSLGYEYSGNRHKLHSVIKWLGWYPVLESRMDFGHYPYFEKFSEPVADPYGLTNGYRLTNTLSLPLTFRGGRFTKYLYLSASSMLSNDHIYLRDLRTYDKGQNQLTGRIYFSNYHRPAIRDIHPRWAQIADISYSFYPFDKEIYGDIITARSAFYIPGFLKNNGFKIRLEAEKQNPEKFIMGNRASFSRGYIGYMDLFSDSYENIISKEIRFASVDYFMPLLYPDINISSLLYLTRIRTNFFFDYTRGKGNYLFKRSKSITGNEEITMDFHDYTETFSSFGVQLLTDFYVLRIPFIITAGVEAAWRELRDYPYLKMIFNIDIYGMSISRKRL